MRFCHLTRLLKKCIIIIINSKFDHLVKLYDSLFCQNQGNNKHYERLNRIIIIVKLIYFYLLYLKCKVYSIIIKLNSIE